MLAVGDRPHLDGGMGQVGDGRCRDIGRAICSGLQDASGSSGRCGTKAGSVDQ